MRILHVDSGKDMRGGQWQVLYLLEELGNGNILLCPDGGPLMQAARERGIDARPLSIGAVASLSRQCELTHVHDARSHTWAVTTASSPVVVSRRVAFPIGQTWLSRWKYSRPAHFIAVSEFVKSILCQAEVPPAKISVVYDGVRVPAEKTKGEKIVALETEDPMKGSDLLRKAAEIAGLEIHYSRDLERDLPDASLFVYVTRSEGLGSAALLAMAKGIPVVASRTGGLPEIVEHGRTGLLTDNDPHAIAAAITKAKESRSEMCCQAREQVESRFSTTAMADGTREVYRKVLTRD